jgi:hypothetical protein
MRLLRPTRPVDLTTEPMEDTWSVIEGDYEGRPMIARFRTGAKHLAGRPPYGIQIGVAVPFLAATDDGLPGSSEVRQLAAFEDELIRLAGDRGLFVGAITTNGMREFVLYTASPDWIAQFHEGLRASLPDHDVQVIAHEDRHWSVYRQFVPA